MRFVRRVLVFSCLLPVFFVGTAAFAGESWSGHERSGHEWSGHERSPHADHAWPERVLITNDQGIDESRLYPLADAFSQMAETFVVVSTQNPNGRSSQTREDKRVLEIKRGFQGKNLSVFMVKGMPVDCIEFALGGILRDEPPDVVIAGIDAGPDLGVSWLRSGTIGAARVAASYGLRAIAVSGLDAGDSESLEMASQWLVALTRSALVRGLEAGRYLTVSFPSKPVSEIKGVKISHRSPLPEVPVFQLVWQDDAAGEVWIREPKSKNRFIPHGSDEAAFRDDYIVIVPMKVDENDYQQLPALRREMDLPPWPPSGDEDY